MNNKKKIILPATLLITLISLTVKANAKNISDVINGLNQTAVESHIKQNVTVFGITGTFIFLLLGVLGSIFLLLVIFGGLTWMLAAGNEEKITKARSTITHAVIGLLIVLAAYLLTNFVIFQLSDNLTTGGTPAENNARNDSGCTNSNGVCQNNATAGQACTIGNAPGTYQTDLCLSNPSPTYLCCVPN